MNYTREDVRNLVLRMWHEHRVRLRSTQPAKMKKIGRDTAIISGGTNEAVLYCLCGWESGAFAAYSDKTGENTGQDFELVLEHMISVLDRELSEVSA